MATGLGPMVAEAQGAFASKSSRLLQALNLQLVRLAPFCAFSVTKSDRETLAAFVERAREQTLVLTALLLWLGIFHFNTLVLVTALVYLPHPAALSVFILYATLMLIPVDDHNWLGTAFSNFVAQHAPRHFPLKLIYEDLSAIDPKRAYIITLEPHSVLPLGAIAFCKGSGLSPFAKVKVLASTALAWVPVARHAYAWLGMAAVSRPTFQSLLRNGTTCVLIPGGVQECLYMRDEEEVLFLKNRKGFIKLALIEGAPLLPAFCFGQRNAYRFWYPKQRWFYDLARRLRFAPLCYWGMYGTPIPYTAPMTLVVGKPIDVAQVPVPTNAQIEALHTQFLLSMKQMYDRHKEACGSGGIELVIS